jgi:hypothetical protein
MHIILFSNLSIMTYLQQKRANIKILIYKTIPASFTCPKLFQHEGTQEVRTLKKTAQI